MRVHLDANLTRKIARDAGLQDAADLLDVVLQVLGDLLELDQPARPVDVQQHDRELRDVDLADGRFLDVAGHLGLGLVDLVANLLQGVVDIGFGQELHPDGRRALGGFGADLVDVAQVLDLLLDLDGDQVLDVLGRDAEVLRGHDNDGYLDVGRGLTRQRHVGIGPGHEHQNHQHKDGRPVLYGGIREYH